MLAPALLIGQRTNMKTIYSYNATTIDGEEISLDTFKGKKLLIVNTASECGLTPQYKQLEELYQEYGGDDFVILGFPSNDFGQQEPGSNSDIAQFCEINYGVTFPMMAKISVKGDDIHPLYQFLTSKSLNGLEDNKVSWNFQKYLIDENGMLAKVLPPTTLPTDLAIVNWLNPE
jgi:glutathione peroxidase